MATSKTRTAPLVDWQLVVLASTEALLLERDYPTPRLWRVRINDVFPTESGEGNGVVDIQSENILETKNGRTNLAFGGVLAQSGRLRNRRGMDALQIHPATAAAATAAAAPAPAAAAASASNKRKHEDEGTLIEEVD